MPHFIATAASSPFYRGIDTGFDSCRLNVVAAFPLSGRMPQFETWAQFLAFFERLRTARWSPWFTPAGAGANR